ncbi:uncharacterized protein LOC125685535 [Lagopus muta]|nr:uncharacterized protein LOC125685535 [Lagopus muta]
MPPPASAYCISQQAVRLDVTLSRDAGRRGVGRKRGPEAGAAAEAEPTGGGAAMVSGKQLADFGYKAFSGSMMLLTAYGGYLCGVRAYRLLQNRRARQASAGPES